MAGWVYVGVSKLWGQTRMLEPCGRPYGIIREMFLDGCIDDTCLACLLRLFFPSCCINSNGSGATWL